MNKTDQEHSGKSTYKNNIKWFALCHPCLEGVDSQASVFSDLDGMAVLLEDLDGQLLIHQVIFRQQNVEGDIIRRRDGADGVGLQCRDQGRREVLRGDWSCHLRTYTVIQAPFHCAKKERIAVSVNLC